MKKIYLSLVAVAMAGGVFAQAPYATEQYDFAKTGKHSGQITTVDGRTFDSGDRTDYYTENFDAMSALDGTGTNWLAEIASGGVGFELTSTGHANDAGSTFTIPSLATSTPTKWILLDSDSDGSTGVIESATLTSPTIDATAAGTLPLKLEFDQFFAEWEPTDDPEYDTLWVGISDDDGASWEEIRISDGVGREGRPNPETVSLNISSLVAPPYDELKIRFRWDGSWAYGWQIDNVKIAELPDNDLTVTSVFRGDLVNAFMYSKVPQAQAQEFIIGADIQNIGFSDQTNIVLNWEIFDPSMSSVGSGTSSTSIATLANGENDTIWVSTGVTPTELGTYTIEYNVSADATDDAPANNDVTDDYFELTNDIYGADYGDFSTSWYNWGGNDNLEAAIGNVYEIVTDGVIGAIDAQLDDSENVVDEIVEYRVFKYDTDSEEFIEEDRTDEYTAVASDQGNIVRIVFDSPVSVSAGDIVLVSAGHFGGDPGTGFRTAGKVGTGAVQGTDAVGASLPTSSEIAAVVRAVMTDFTGEEELAKMENFSIYPNPANDFLVVNLTLFESENTVVNVLDITGKVVETINLGTVNGDSKVNIDLNEYTSGVYFIEMTNEDGKQVKKFIKK